jgi:hypothetical protein
VGNCWIYRSCCIFQIPIWKIYNHISTNRNQLTEQIYKNRPWLNQSPVSYFYKMAILRNWGYTPENIQSKSDWNALIQQKHRILFHEM